MLFRSNGRSISQGHMTYSWKPLNSGNQSIIYFSRVIIGPMTHGGGFQGHSSLDAPSELNPPQRIPSPFETPLVPQAEG